MISTKRAILCMDVDGTLIDAGEKIHPKDVALLQVFPEDLQPVLTTGRSLYSAKGVLHQNGLFEGKPLPMPGVFMNGGAAYHAGEKLASQHSFAPHTRQTLVELAKTHPRASFSFFTLDEVYLVNPNAFSRHISQLHHLVAREAASNAIPEEVIKLMILDQDRRTLEKIKTQTAEWDVETAYSLPYAFEINPTGINKANTLVALLLGLKLNRLPVFTTGDGENDLSLFNLSQVSFAPASSNPKVLQAADQIIQREKDGLISPILKEIRSILA